MNIKSNKGITLIALMITVIILAVLAFSVVRIGVNLTGTAKFTNVETNMLIIKSKSETIANEVSIGEKEESALYGAEELAGDLKGLYRLRYDELKEMGIETTNKHSNEYKNEKENARNKKESEKADEEKGFSDYYIQYEIERKKDGSGNTIDIDVTVTDVVYGPGVENSGKMYHKLTEMLKVEDKK